MTKKLPAISVVLPVYNAARFLQVALDSMMAQTLTNFELIAVDDGSTDASLEILVRQRARDPRLQIISRHNTGIVGALNEGLANARGRLVARMDADDEASPERFAEQFHRFESDPRLVALGSAVTFMDSGGRSVQSCPRPLLHNDIERSLLKGDGGALIHPSVMFRANALQAIGGYQQSAQYLEDLDIYLRLATVGTLGNSAKTLLRYRVHESSINFTRKQERSAIKLTVMRAAYEARGLPFNPNNFPENAADHGDAELRARGWAFTALDFGSRHVAVAHGLRAIGMQPLRSANWRALHYALTAPVKPSPSSQKCPTCSI